LHGLQDFLVAQGFQDFLAAHGLQPFFAAQGLQDPCAAARRGITHFVGIPAARHGLQGLPAPHGLQDFLAAQGLQRDFAAQGLHDLTPAQGLHFLLTAQGLARHVLAAVRIVCVGLQVWAALAAATGPTPAAMIRASAVIEISLASRSCITC